MTPRTQDLSLRYGSAPRRLTPFFYLELSVYWFALSLLWTGMITLVLQQIVEHMAGDQKDLVLGWVLGAGAFVSTIISLIVGTYSDHSRFKGGKRRPYILTGTILTVPFLLWLAYLGSLPPSMKLVPYLALSFCLIQFWANVATSPYQALVPDLIPKERQGTASAYMGVGSILGQLLSFVVCSSLIHQEDGLWKVCIVLSLALVAAALYTQFRIVERPATDNPALQTGLIETLKHSFTVDVKGNRDFFWLIASRFVINLGFYTAITFIAYYASDTLKAPEGTATKILMIATISGLVGNFPAGILADRVSKKLVVYVSCIVTGIAAVLFLLTSSVTVALVAAFFFGAGFGAFQAVDWALATNLLPDADEAKYMGVWHAAFTVPQVFAPLVGGLVANLFNHGAAAVWATEHFGSGFGYRVVLSLVLLYLIAGTVLIRPIRERVYLKLSENAA